LSRKLDTEALESARKVQPFIDLANATPAGLPDLVAEAQARIRDLPATESKGWAPAAERHRQESLGKQREAISRFKGTPLEPYFPPENWSPDFYELCRIVRGTFELLIGAKDVLDGPIEGHTNLGDLPPTLFVLEQAWLDDFGKIRIEDRSSLEVDLYRQFRDALNGLEAKRLGSCPVCKHFFLSVRHDQKACTSVCANRLRFKNWYNRQHSPKSKNSCRKRDNREAAPTRRK